MSRIPSPPGAFPYFKTLAFQARANKVLQYRITIPETPRYTFDIARDTYKAERDVGKFLSGKASGKMDEVQRMEAICYQGKLLRAPRSSFKNFQRHFRQWKNAKLLLGTALSWMFLDIGKTTLSPYVHIASTYS